MGDSYLEDVFVDTKKKKKHDWVEYAGRILEKYEDKIVLPDDVVISDGKETRVVAISEIPTGWKALDVGPKTAEKFTSILEKSKTIFWNGPMGTFEDKGFEKGSEAIAKAMEKSDATTIVSGGDTIEAAKRFSDVSKITHISLAGGATLELLSGKKLPALEMLLE